MAFLLLIFAVFGLLYWPLIVCSLVFLSITSHHIYDQRVISSESDPPTTLARSYWSRMKFIVMIAPLLDSFLFLSSEALAGCLLIS